MLWLLLVVIGVFLRQSYQAPSLLADSTKVASCVTQKEGGKTPKINHYTPVSFEEIEQVAQGAAKGPKDYQYKAASSEAFVYQHMKEFGFHKDNNPKTCPAIEREEIKPSLDQYREELKAYYKLIEDFKPIDDLRYHLDYNHSICQKLDLVPGGLPQIFPSQQLSLTPSGYVEPLLPPLRHLDYCDVQPSNSLWGWWNYDKERAREALMDMTYLVHDFGHMCRQLKKTSRIVLIDMGASLEFHQAMETRLSPPIYLTSVYQKMGFKFDHIYAFEITPASPGTVFELVPETLQSAYHWINIGVSSKVGAKNNPLTMLLREFNEDDLIVVKLDIDTSFIEVPLAHQILENDHFANLIDQFYFEHHVHMQELRRSWGDTMEGTVEDSLKLFTGIREKGIASHYWP